MRNWRQLCIFLAIIPGCARYEALPLAPAAVEATLAVPVVDVLQARVDDLSHPTLKPVTIDFQHGLTPESAAVLAVILNPSLRAIRDQHGLACAQLLQARLLPNPTLDFTLDPVTGGNTLGTVTGYSIGPSWEVTALISHQAKVAAANAGARSAQLEVAWQEWQFAEAAKKAVYDLLFLRAEVKELAEVNQRLRENRDLIRSAVEAHNRTLLDLAAADAAAEKSQTDLLSVQRDFRQQQLTLNRALGFAPGAAINIQDLPVFASSLSMPSEQELNRNLEHHRLDLLALREGYQSQEQTLRVAVLSQFPRIVLGFHQASDTTNVHTTGLGVTIDLPIFDQQQGAIAQEKATRQKLFDEYAVRLLDARSAIAQSLADIQSLNRQIAAAREAIPAMQRLVKVYEAAVREHNLDVLSFYGAQNDLAQKRVDLLKLQQQLMDNQVAMELAAGRFLPRDETPLPATRPATQPATQSPTTEAIR